MTSPAITEIHVYGSAGWLECGTKRFRCVVGRGGIIEASHKREGDGATPAGRYPLRQLYYRSDKLGEPETGLPVRALEPDDAWSDDPTDPAHYNRLIKLPYAGRHETMWHSDNLYDLVVAIGYNDQPAIPGKGSAIFMHVASESLMPTEGCIALSRNDLLEVLKFVGPTTEMVVHR